jgi:hypothetical protein
MLVAGVVVMKWLYISLLIDNQYLLRLSVGSLRVLRNPHAMVRKERIVLRRQSRSHYRQYPVILSSVLTSLSFSLSSKLRTLLPFLIVFEAAHTASLSPFTSLFLEQLGLETSVGPMLPILILGPYSHSVLHFICSEQSFPTCIYNEYDYTTPTARCGSIWLALRRQQHPYKRVQLVSFHIRQCLIDHARHSRCQEDSTRLSRQRVLWPCAFEREPVAISESGSNSQWTPSNLSWVSRRTDHSRVNIFEEVVICECEPNLPTWGLFFAPRYRKLDHRGRRRSPSRLSATASQSIPWENERVN